jgi:hypothetical protein
MAGIPPIKQNNLRAALERIPAAIQVHTGRAIEEQQSGDFLAVAHSLFPPEGPQYRYLLEFTKDVDHQTEGGLQFAEGPGVALFNYGGVLAADPHRFDQQAYVDAVADEIAAMMVARIAPASRVQMYSEVNDIEHAAAPWSVAVRFVVRVVAYPVAA